jgi:hypothetical protein
MGAKGVYETAVLNGIDFSSKVRYFSAVKLEWNTLANYVEVTIGSQKINAWYGKFAPMSLSDGLDQSKYQQLVAEAKVDSSKRAPKSPQKLSFNLKSKDKAFSEMSEDFLRGQTKGAASHWDTVDLNKAGITEAEKQKLALLVETGALACAICICATSRALNGTTSVFIASPRKWSLTCASSRANGLFVRSPRP